jgi:hypothetical protein
VAATLPGRAGATGAGGTAATAADELALATPVASTVLGVAPTGPDRHASAPRTDASGDGASSAPAATLAGGPATVSVTCSATATADGDGLAPGGSAAGERDCEPE